MYLSCEVGILVGTINNYKGLCIETTIKNFSLWQILIKVFILLIFDFYNSYMNTFYIYLYVELI